jgi:plasmid stabilization system protein ParE
VRIEISKRAKRELERAAGWWKDPDILWDELEAAGRRLLEEPEAGRRWVSSKVTDQPSRDAGRDQSC